MTIRYTYDGDRIIAEYGGSGTLPRKFVYGPGIDEPICLIDVANGNATYYYHFDGLGSIVALSDVNKVLVERYAYDVFGRPTIRDPNRVVLAESAFGNPYLFTGRVYDAESGLYYYRARYYDYATGRLLQPDPIGYPDGLNSYAYVANNPMNWADPSGLCKQDLLNALRDSIRDAILSLPNGQAMVMAGDMSMMTMDYYDIFRGVGYGRSEAAMLALIMGAGKFVGYSTLSEGLVGVNVMEEREIHGLERFGYIGFGGVQTALSAAGLAEGLNALTTGRALPARAPAPVVTPVRTFEEVTVRSTFGADGGTSMIVKTINAETGETLRVIHRAVDTTGKVIHEHVKFPK